NQLAPGTAGGWTTDFTTGQGSSIYAASRDYPEQGIPTIVVTGEAYAMGSSPDCAATGTLLLGVKAVIAKSYERIHRSNLVGMGVLPLQFLDGQDPEVLGLDGTETFDIELSEPVEPRQRVRVNATRADGTPMTFEVISRLDTPVELDYFRNGGILHTVLR